MRIIFRLVLTALGVVLASKIVPGIVVASFGTALLVALVLAVLNVTLGFVLKILTLPFSILTFGLFSLVINGFVFWMASFVKGFTVAGFFPAFLGALIVAVISTLGKKLLN